METERLRLRRWGLHDASNYRRIAADPLVVATLGEPPTAAGVRAMTTAQNVLLETLGHCLWAIERRESPDVIGRCGIKLGPDRTPIAGLPELGWTLYPGWQGQGVATEAANAVVTWAWAQTAYPRLHAITTPANAASRAVMVRLAMHRIAGDDFDHPALPDGDSLRRHVSYTIGRPPARPPGNVRTSAAAR